MMPTDELRALLDERGIKWWPSDDPRSEDIITHWCVGPFKWTAIDGEKDLWLNAGIAGYEPLAPKQAVAATVGTEPWEPSKEWKAWHESLKHDNPTSIREAVENILHEAIDFGGDMGPNGNVWSGVDEGTVLTDGCINGWVKSIEEIAATVGIEPDEATMLKLHDRMNAALLDYESAMGIDGGNGANTVPLVIEMHRIIEDAATAGAETCTMDGQYGNYRCSNCGKSWQLGCVRPKEQSWKYCPHCRAQIIEEVTE